MQMTLLFAAAKKTRHISCSVGVGRSSAAAFRPFDFRGD